MHIPTFSDSYLPVVLSLTESRTVYLFGVRPVLRSYGILLSVKRLRRSPQDPPRDIQVPLAPSDSRRLISFAATVLRSFALLRYRSRASSHNDLTPLQGYRGLLASVFDLPWLVEGIHRLRGKRCEFFALWSGLGLWGLCGWRFVRRGVSQRVQRPYGWHIGVDQCNDGTLRGPGDARASRRQPRHFRKDICCPT
jgi:hypothetical protein